MKTYKFKVLLLITVLFFSCTSNQNEKEFDKLDIWENIRIAAKEKNINYLLKISNDTLDCIECNNGESWITKEAFFAKYIGQIEVSNTKEYTYSTEEIEKEKRFTVRYRVNYAYGGNGTGERHNSIYTILVGEKEIQFQGLIGVP